MKDIKTFKNYFRLGGQIRDFRLDFVLEEEKKL